MSASSDDEHPYVKYGTPLEEIDESETKPSMLKSNVPVFDQIVTDEEGRRRFHGAFTGGFSAGYYNTVGTKEGWKPSTFLSSRSNKSKRKTFQANDFMDDEDRGDFGIAPKTLSTSTDFTSKHKRNAIQEKQLNIQEEKMTLSFGANLLDCLVLPMRNNIGIKMLKSMGWKEGQGLGPHVVRRKKKKKKKSASKMKVYGCRLPGADDPDSDDENIPENFQFAPKDMMPISILHKDDNYGIGYSRLDPTAALHVKEKKSSAVKARTKSGSKLSFYGQAFGVGAYEEEDDDIYAQDSMSNYDSVMSIEKNPDNTYGWTKPLAIAGAGHKEAIGYGDTPKILFVHAKREAKLFPKVYPPPPIPNDFDPYKRMKLQRESKRIKDLNLTTVEPSTVLPPSNENQPRLTSQDREALLEDNKSPAPTKKAQSIFDFISFEDRQRMEAAKRKPVELGFKGDNKIVEQPTMVDRSKPLCDATSLKPFSNNPEKLRRYEQYERAIRQRKKDPYSVIESNLTEWERKHEQHEFARLSQVYLHLSTNISSKFTKASENEDNDSVVQREVTEPAAKMKMFGIMTHDSVEWHPDPLLCKRFNVPDPYPNSESVGVSKPFGGFKILAVMGSSSAAKTPDAGHVASEEDSETKSKTGIVSDTKCPPAFNKSRPFIGGRWDRKPVFAGPMDKPAEKEDEKSEKKEDTQTTQELEEKSPERPPMELFKSIFASSEEDTSSSEEEKEDDDDATSDQNVKTNEQEESEPVIKRASAADVFMRPIPVKENILQQAVNDPTPPKESEPDHEPMEQDEVNEQPDEKNGSDDGYFGPILPPVRPASNGVESVDRGTPPKHDKKQLKHKKKKKHEHKGKKKKKDKHR
ncbi:G patch domain-containing protein 1-like [Clavelina lepadiformis]|uniref:G patch domain-containing protein 1-like n=1 Tax=Clavelina lepadiformis TaxID=159417 RepID=UPI0040422551